MSCCPYRTYTTMSCVWHAVMAVIWTSPVCATASKPRAAETLFYQKCQGPCLKLEHDLLSQSSLHKDLWQPQSHPYVQIIILGALTDEVFCQWIISVILVGLHNDCNTLILCGDYVDWNQKTGNHFCHPEDAISHCHCCYLYSSFSRPLQRSLLLGDMTGWDRDYI